MYKPLIAIILLFPTIMACVSTYRYEPPNPVPFDSSTIAKASYSVPPREYCSKEEYGFYVPMVPVGERSIRTTCSTALFFSDDSLVLNKRDRAGWQQIYLEERVGTDKLQVVDVVAKSELFSSLNELSRKQSSLQGTSMSEISSGSNVPGPSPTPVKRPDFAGEYPISRAKLHWFGPVALSSDQKVAVWLRAIESEFDALSPEFQALAEREIADGRRLYRPKSFEAGLFRGDNLIHSFVSEFSVLGDLSKGSNRIDYRILFSLDDQSVFFMSGAKEMSIYDIRQRKMQQVACGTSYEIRGEREYYNCLGFYFQTYCASCTDEGWQIEAMRQSKSGLRAILEFTERDTEFPRRIRVFDIDAEKSILLLPLEDNAPPNSRRIDVAISPDGKWLAVNDTSGKVHIFDLDVLISN